jgi:hypothetical protein
MSWNTNKLTKNCAFFIPFKTLTALTLFLLLFIFSSNAFIIANVVPTCPPNST